MNETSLSLLERVKDPNQTDSWHELIAVYRPLLENWLRRYQVQPADADDLLQEVLAVVLRELPQFEHNRRAGAFRNWLRTILANRLKEYWRARQYRPQSIGGTEFDADLQALEDGASGVSRLWNDEHDAYLMKRLCGTVRARFDERTWAAFEQQAVDGQRADAVAAELGMPLASVYAAKSRVLNALRREAVGLLDVS